MDVTEHSGTFNGVVRDDDYDIIVNGGTMNERTFVGLRMPVTWEFENRICYYVGNIQGGVVTEAASDSVIEGLYTDYLVPSLFETHYEFSRFDEGLCIPTA